MTVLLACGLTMAPALRAEAAPQKNANEAGDPDLTLWKWANFLVLFGVIAYYGIKLGKPYFEGETEGIRKGLDEARQRRAEAERRSVEVHQKLAHLGAEIDGFRREVLEAQGVAAERMRETLRAERERLHSNTTQQIETLVKHERLALQRHASALALKLAEQRLRLMMNGDTQDALTGQFVEGLRA